MASILKGKVVADDIKKTIKEKSKKLKEKGIIPAMAIVRVGEREDDIAYERSVLKNCNDAGIQVNVFTFDQDISMSEFGQQFKQINDMDKIHGILLFRPLPKQLNIDKIKYLIDPAKDIDCMHPDSLRKVFEGETNCFYPCTPEAVVAILKYYNIDLAGKRAAIVNRSMVLGKPLAMMLLNENATVTICHSKTENLKEILKEADVVITGVGKGKYFKAMPFSEKNTVIDVGINYIGDEMCGDVDFAEAKEVVSAITPVPGGVGSVTTAILLKHVVLAAELQ